MLLRRTTKSNMSKQEIYENLLPQVVSLVQDEGDLVANMANVAAVLHEAFGFWWTGFYRVRQSHAWTDDHVVVGALDASALPTGRTTLAPVGDPDNQKELVLGPFQGPIACTRIPYGKGVCGTAWQRGETIIVPDVHQFPGHIACSSLSQSEIVVPVFSGNEVIAVLDIDSKELATFDDTDRCYLEQIVKCLA